MNIHIDIYRNKMVFSHDGRQITVEAAMPYSTNRLLVGTFMPAVITLKQGLSQLGTQGFFKRKPQVTITAREQCEGGLSEIEQQCLIEVAHTAGVSKVELTSPQ